MHENWANTCFKTLIIPLERRKDIGFNKALKIN